MLLLLLLLLPQTFTSSHAGDYVRQNVVFPLKMSFDKTLVTSGFNANDSLIICVIAVYSF